MKAAIVLSFSEEVLLVLLASSNNAANSSSILISVSFPPIAARCVPPDSGYAPPAAPDIFLLRSVGSCASRGRKAAPQALPPEGLADGSAAAGRCSACALPL